MSDQSNWLEQPVLPDGAMPLHAVIVTQYVDGRDGNTYTLVSVRGLRSDVTALGLLQKGVLKIGMQAELDLGKEDKL